MRFEPIRPENFSLAYGFLKDSFAISFGEDAQLWPEKLRTLSESEYFEILRRKLSQHPEAAVHAFDENGIVGQIEWSIKNDDKTCGYVSLYYLIPSKRGRGLGKYLDAFVSHKLQDLGCRRIQLTVEPTNAQAIAFYQKSGWIELRRHPQYGGLLMEKKL